MRTVKAIAALLACASACSQVVGAGPPAVSVTGVVEVLASSGGPETMILTEDGTGVTWVLTGDVASELRESRGVTVTVAGLRPSPAVDARGRPLLDVRDYVIEGEPGPGSDQP